MRTRKGGRGGGGGGGGNRGNFDTGVRASISYTWLYTWPLK